MPQFQVIHAACVVGRTAGHRHWQRQGAELRAHQRRRTALDRDPVDQRIVPSVRERGGNIALLLTFIYTTQSDGSYKLAH